MSGSSLSGISFGSAMQKHRFGTPNVHYTSDGRAVYSTDQSGSQTYHKDFTASSGSKPGYLGFDSFGESDYIDNGRSAGRSIDSVNRSNRYQNHGGYNKGYNASNGGYRSGSGVTSSGTVGGVHHHDSFDKRDPSSYARNDDAPNQLISNETDYRRYTNNGDWSGFDKTELIADRNLHGEHGVLARQSTQPSRRHDWFNAGVLFIFMGILLLATGIVNVCFCLDYHYYSRFWIGLIVFEFGVFCLLHKGDYDSRWRNYDLTILGVITTIAAFIGSTFILKTLINDIKLISLSKDSFLDYQILRTDKPHISLSNDTRTWMCLGNDGVTLVCHLFSAIPLLIAAFVANKYWDFNHPTNMECQPFFRRQLFNPFGQLPVSEVVILLGILTRWACEGTDFVEYWSPVWAGGMSILAAGLSIASAKRPEKCLYSGWALLLQLVSVSASVGASVICIMGMSKNINALNEDSFPDSYHKNVVISSAVIFVLAAAAVLVSAFFSVGNIVRIIHNLMRRPDSSNGPFVDTLPYISEGYLSPQETPKRPQLDTSSPYYKPRAANHGKPYYNHDHSKYPTSYDYGYQGGQYSTNIPVNGYSRY